MTDSEFAQKVYELAIESADSEVSPHKIGKRSRSQRALAEQAKEAAEAFLKASRSPRYIAMRMDAFVDADAESEQQIAEYYREKSERNPQLHWLESLQHMRLDARSLYADDVSDEFRPDEALVIISTAYRDAARIAAMLAEKEPVCPQSLPDAAAYQRAWKEFDKYIGRTIGIHLESSKSKYQVNFGPKPPRDLGSDPREWTFPELVAVCSLASRPSSLSDPRETYILLATRLAEQVSHERNMTDLGNLISRKFRRHFVKQAHLSLEKEIRVDHGRMKLPLSDLESSFKPLRDAIRTMQGFAFWPRLHPGDGEIADGVEFIDASALTQAQLDAVERVRMESVDSTRLSLFETDQLHPSLEAFEEYRLHCLGASATNPTKPATSMANRTSSKSRKKGDPPPPAWKELEHAKQAILKALKKYDHRLSAEEVAAEVKKFSSYKLATLRRHFLLLQDWCFIDKNTSMGGYKILRAGENFMSQ